MEFEVDFDAILAEARAGMVVEAPQPSRAPLARTVEPVLVLRDETLTAVIQGLRRGLTLTRACALVGADVRQVKRLAKVDPAVGRRLASAKAHLIADLTDTVVQAATGEEADWRAAAWLLPKLDPSLQEKKKPTVTITKNVLNVGERKELEASTDEDLRRMLGYVK